MNTEEAFILASLKEFVRLWGSGIQASFHLECRNRKAWFKLATELGAPSSHHFIPSQGPSQDHHHSPHGNGGVPPRRQGPGRRRRNQARAAAHRARQSEQLANPVNHAAVAAADSCLSRPDLSSPAAAASTFQPQSSSSPVVQAVQGQQEVAAAAASADLLPQHPSVAGAAASSPPLRGPSEVPLHHTAPHRPSAAAMVLDEFCSDKTYSEPSRDNVKNSEYLSYLQDLSRSREEELKKLTKKLNFGFKPRNAKPPF